MGRCIPWTKSTWTAGLGPSPGLPGPRNTLFGPFDIHLDWSKSSGPSGFGPRNTLTLIKYHDQKLLSIGLLYVQWRYSKHLKIENQAILSLRKHAHET